MAWTTLKAAVDAVVKANGNQEITGTNMNQTLDAIIDAVGENETFKGIANPSTVPGTPDGNLFYIATQPGIYANFNGYVIDEEGIYLLRWNGGAWINQIVDDNSFTLKKRQEQQFNIFNQDDNSGNIDVEYSGTDAIITLTGDLLMNLPYDPNGVITVNLFSRIIQSGNKIITVPHNTALYLDIAEALNSEGGTIPDSAYTMTANVADYPYTDEYPTDKILLFNNWNGDFKASAGMIKDYLVAKYAKDASDVVLNKRIELGINIVKNHANASISVSYDGGGNATITMNEQLVLYTARKEPYSSNTYTRLLLSGTKIVTVNKGESLYFDINDIISSATGAQIPESTYIIQSALVEQDKESILAFSNWYGEEDNHQGIIADFIKSDKIREVPSGEVLEKEVIDTARAKTVLPLNYHPIHERIKPFIQNYMTESKDIEIVLLGDSILGRTVNNTPFSTTVQQSKPPMLISPNIANGIWEKLDNGNILHSRWDKPGVFTETGAGWTDYFGETLKAVWDDAGDRAGETREFSGTGTASTQFSFLAENRRLNFIYRTSTEGNAALGVAISGGNGFIEVYNGASWVEANGYSFSQLYTGSGTGYGNTEYQRRLKFRKVTAEIPNAHTITISKAATGSAESLMYWGIEQTNRDFVVSVRNIARGGHDMQLLWNTIRTEFDNFDTDLVLFELPIINMKMYVEEPAYFWSSTIRGVYPKLLDGGQANSLKSISNSFADFQVVPMLLNETRDWMNSDGTLKDFERNGTLYNSDSYFNYLASKFWEYDNEISFVHVWPWIKRNSVETFGDLYTAWLASATDSEDSYCEDNAHPNDYGVENLLLYILPIFDFNIS